MLRILGRTTSSNVQKVLWTATTLGVPFEREDVGGRHGRNREADYLALNPNGLVPTVFDGDLVMWESNSVCRYLCNRYGPSAIYPAEPAKRVLVERWMDWQLSVMVPALVPLYFLLFRLPEAKRTPDAIVRLAQDTAAPFAILEARLADRLYLEGDAPTLADIGNGIWAHRWFSMGQGNRDSNVGRWLQRLSENDAFRQHVVEVPLE
ncbi:MAG TPA: glutathione S-transferase family protein [Stellaceae bacterium]